MRKIIVFIIVSLSAFSFQLSASYAENLSSKHLIANAKSLDGKNVAYKGELVTAIMNRGEYSWVNLSDGENAIGIWCKSSQLDPVKFVGNYKNIGDILEVEGKFNRACPYHGGELDIHASNVRVVKTGAEVKENIDKKTIRISIALFLLTLFVVIIFRKRT